MLVSQSVPLCLWGQFRAFGRAPTAAGSCASYGCGSLGQKKSEREEGGLSGTPKMKTSWGELSGL